MASSRHGVMCNVKQIHSRLNRCFVIPPLKLGREWVVIFHSFVQLYLPLHVSTPMMVKLFSVCKRGT